LLVSIINLSIFATRTGGRQTIMPLLGAQIGIPIAALGGIFTMMALVNMLLVVPASALADRYGRRWTIVPSGILVGLSLFWMAGATTYTAFFLAAFVHAVSSSISASAPVAYAVDIAPPGMRGITLGMFRSAGDVGVMAGPPILGLVADNGTFGQALIVNGVFMIVASLTFLLAREARTHRPAAASATTDPADATPATR
ncbi:MAG: MFS transporter, partial [Chloroflexota bacterium]